MDSKQREDFRNLYNASHVIRERLSVVIEDLIKHGENRTLKDYDNPSWSHYQAHFNGRNEALRQVLLLLK